MQLDEVGFLIEYSLHLVRANLFFYYCVWYNCRVLLTTLLPRTFIVTTVHPLGYNSVHFHTAIDISLAVSLNSFLFQPVGLLSFSWFPFSAAEGSLGDRETAVVSPQMWAKCRQLGISQQVSLATNKAPFSTAPIPPSKTIRHNSLCCASVSLASHF